MMNATGQTVGSATPALRVKDLTVEVIGSRELLHGITLDVMPGEMHGLVGETGSGKSMTAQSIMGLLPRNVQATAGSIELAGRPILGMSQRALQRLRGSDFGMIFQNPRTALSPMHQVRRQMDNVLRAHTELDKAERYERTLEYLSLVGIADPRRIAAAYPHELSGGLAQRVVIATVLVCEPSFVIADEPTTGLDATVQMQILELIAGLQRKLGLGVLMITHDLGIVAQYCTSVSVMYAGNLVEQGSSEEILTRPTAEYTRALIDASTLSGIGAHQPVSVGAAA
jgi:ABC-type dipeptide/oligopeptide/nickel transport system ATPase component